MARYTDVQQAEADGFRFAYEPDASRYAVYRSGSEGSEDLVGEAHFSLRGSELIDFDHTVVIPELRGTGISGLLARFALLGPAASGRRIAASCWFIDGYLAKHPEILEEIAARSGREE